MEHIVVLTCSQGYSPQNVVLTGILSTKSSAHRGTLHKT